MTTRRPHHGAPALDLDGGWHVVERDVDAARAGAMEAVFAVGNGYLGLRGTPEEASPVHAPGTILNGFHETWPITYPEEAFGLARTGQTILNAPDGTVIRLFVDGEPLDLTRSRILGYERTLDMRSGVLLRRVEFRDGRGRRLVVASRRLASLADRHLAALYYEVCAPDDDLELTLVSELVTHAPREASGDPRAGKAFGLQPVAAEAVGSRAALRLATRNSGLQMACGMAHEVQGANAIVTDAAGGAAQVVFAARLAGGQPLRLTKFLAYHWAADGRDLLPRVHRTLDRASRAGYAAVERAHTARVHAFWRRSDIELDGPAGLQATVRFNLFAVMQATARADGLGVPAKGVTGHGYEGHYFWDTEIFLVPLLAHTSPRWAKQILEFRCRMLGAARRRAREVGHRGALYPWRTINGAEASAFYAAGTAQYHINADIAFAMHQYNRVTGDLGFILDQGAEVLVETARIWLQLGHHTADRRFCINAVTGPDEYTTVVDNNAYTNLMAKEHLEIAIRVTEWLQGFDAAAYAELVAATGLSEPEIASWRRAAAALHVPRHAGLGIVLQDERFLERKRWDFDATPADRYPLLLHHHPLELYRHQVIKQTDVVLASYLVGHQMTPGEKRRTFDYYDPLTTGDSSLSACIQSVMASEVGHPELALDYFLTACRVDLHDLHANTADGLHIASCGGTWLALVAGFGGLRDADGEVRLSPRLPDGWRRLRFRLEVRGQVVEVDMTPAATAYRLLEGRTLQLWHFDEPLRLAPGGTLTRRCATSRTPIRLRPAA